MSEIVLRTAPRLTSEVITEGQVSHFDVHPVYPLVVYLINAPVPTLVCYDYCKKVILIRKAVKDVLSISERKPKSDSHSSSSSSYFRETDELTHRVRIPLQFKRSGHLPVSTVTEESHSRRGSTNAPNYGNVKSIQFFDHVALAPKFCRKEFSPLCSSAFHSKSMFLLTFDSALVFYDATTNRLRMITSSDLEKAAPICAQCVHPELCIIGCSDGSLRLWNTSSWSLLRSLPRHALSGRSSEISAILSLPAIPFTAGEESSFEGAFRFLSMGSDSVGIVWMGSILPTGAIDTVDPIAWIKNPKKESMFATTSSTPSFQRYDPAQSLLFTVSSNQKTRVWDLSSLPSMTPSTSDLTAKRLTSLSLSPARRISYDLKAGLGMKSAKSKAREGSTSLTTIHCVSVIKPGASLISGKLTDCALLFNANLYPGGCALLYANKTDFLNVAITYTQIVWHLLFYYCYICETLIVLPVETREFACG